MKMLRNIMVGLLSVIIIVACAGCTELLQKLDNEEIRGYTEKMLDYAIENDIDAAYSLIDDACTKTDFTTAFGEINSLFADINQYELSLLSIYTNNTFNNGKSVKTTTATYKMTADSSIFIITAETNSDYKNLSFFNVAPYEKTDYYSTGSITTLSKAKPVQWVFLLLNIPIIAIALFALIDCCKRNIKLKVFWIIIILLGFATVSATVGISEIHLNLQIGWIINYSALIIYGSGTALLRLMLPVGAIVYFILRKKLTVTPDITSQAPLDIPKPPTSNGSDR